MTVSVIAALTVGLLWAAGLDIRGSTTCPTPTEVADRAAPLLSASGGVGHGLILRIEEVPVRALGQSDRSGDARQPATGASATEIEVRLEGDDPESAPLASRRLARESSCGELAEAIAVIIASWAGRYDTPAPPSLSLSFPADETSGLVVRGAPAVAPSRTTVWSIGAGAGAVGATQGDVTPQGGVEVTATARTSRWFGRLLVAGSGERMIRVATGNAAWNRAMVMPSIGRSWGESLFFEASGGPVAGPVFVRGQGFSPNQEDVSLAVGVSPSLRVGLRLGNRGRAAVWISTAAVAWLRPHRLAIDMSSGESRLPWLDVMAAGGVSYDIGD